eukprot:scaffold238487_cov19-Tisochrysis_lutea.AAC.1
MVHRIAQCIALAWCTVHHHVLLCAVGSWHDKGTWHSGHGQQAPVSVDCVGLGVSQQVCSRD